MRATTTILVLNSCLFLGTCSELPSRLDLVRESGVLRVVTRNSPTTYYLGADGPTGPEYELAHRFAQHLGVELDMYVADSFGEILPALEARDADIAAAGLTITDARRRLVAFGPPYQDVAQYVVYRTGSRRPRHPQDLLTGQLAILDGSSHEESLVDLREELPGLTWLEDTEAEPDELLYRVARGEIDFTVADSNEFDISRWYHPEVRIGFTLATSEQLAWAFRRDRDISLRREATRFFNELRTSGELKTILNRYYGRARQQQFDYVGTRLFLRHIESRLHRYRPWFEQAGAETGIDWRLLAAVGYQESHWNPDAVSPTGVRGIMMLTQATARQLGIPDRTAPRASILGGARYLARILRKLPERIDEPDRTWLALAAYNVGYGHLEDARVLTERSGANPDRWFDVREHLPLLSQKKWYSQVRRGYARGREPVIYVGNIRSYYDILKWKTSKQGRRLRPPPPKKTITPAPSPTTAGTREPVRTGD